MNKIFMAVPVILLLATSACSKKQLDGDEIAQNVGDQMAAVDEAGQSSGTLAFNEAIGARRTFARLMPDEVDGSFLERYLLPSAYADSCLLDAANQFSSCVSKSIIRTFGGCTVGSATFSGTVTYTWTNNVTNCTMVGAGDKVSRRPNFTITGRRGGSFAATTTGTNGQTITRSATAGETFTFSNDGIKRVLTDSSGATVLDFTTETTSAMTLTGVMRAGRVLTGGSLKVTDNTSGAFCEYAPSNVTWTGTCNCASSGTWTGTCSDGKTTTLTITGCGTATADVGGSTESVTLDRCYGT